VFFKIHNFIVQLCKFIFMDDFSFSTFLFIDSADMSQPCLTCEMIQMGNSMALGDGTCDSCGRIVR
jgi:hypothetical protein